LRDFDLQGTAGTELVGHVRRAANAATVLRVAVEADVALKDLLWEAMTLQVRSSLWACIRRSRCSGQMLQVASGTSPLL
jgi:hypothetical protein